jgi:hypothetical protein
MGDTGHSNEEEQKENTMLTREELVEKVARIDHWGSRGLGSARKTTEHIVTMLEREGVILTGGESLD